MNKLIGALALMVISSLPNAVFATGVPMQLSEQHWRSLAYKNIHANRVTELEQGLKIQVDASASPLIYLFDEPQTISRISVSGMMGALPTIPSGLKQGGIGADDFPFRLGLVVQGDRTLGFTEQLFAAQWVKILFGLAPQWAGIDHIAFLNLANSGVETQFETRREHPRSKGLFTETIISRASADQGFDFSYTLPMPEKVIALWVSIDGDDTRSSYALTVNSISYN